MRKHKLLTQVVHSTAYSYTLVADFGGKKGNGLNYRLNISFWWTRSSWMDLRFPTSYSSFTDIQNINRKPSSLLLLLLLLFTAPRTKYEWRQNYSLKVKNGYFPSQVRRVGNNTLTGWIGASASKHVSL